MTFFPDSGQIAIHIVPTLPLVVRGVLHATAEPEARDARPMNEVLAFEDLHHPLRPRVTKPMPSDEIPAVAGHQAGGFREDGSLVGGCDGLVIPSLAVRGEGNAHRCVAGLVCASQPLL